MKLSFFVIVTLCLCSFNINDLSIQLKGGAVDGATLYKNNCKSCHGKKGKSFVSKPADLTSSKLTLEQRIETITNGSKTNPTMVAFKERLNKEEIRAIATYTMKFIKK